MDLKEKFKEIIKPTRKAKKQMRKLGIVIRYDPESKELWPKWLFKMPEEGIMCPKGYRFAFRICTFDLDYKVLMPIPLNYLANWLRALWHWFRFLLIRHTSIDKLGRKLKAYEEVLKEMSEHSKGYEQEEATYVLDRFREKKHGR